MIVNMSYDEVRDLNNLTNVYDYILRGNSIFDPNQTGVGDTALGWDQYSSTYVYYQVISSTAKVIFKNFAELPMDVWLYPSLGTPSISQAVLMANGNVQRKYVTAVAGAKPICFMKKTNTLKRLNGMSYKDPLNLSAMSANPSTQWYWHCMITTQDPAQAVLGSMEIFITYKVKLTGRSWKSL